MTMGKYISFYKDNPTQDKTDGTLISENGTATSPITAILDASKNESVVIKLAARCVEGYETTSAGASLSVSGEHADRWQFCYHANFTGDDAPSSDLFSSTCVLPKIGAKNVVFWVRAAATTEEKPVNDTDETIAVSARIVAAES